MFVNNRASNGLLLLEGSDVIEYVAWGNKWKWTSRSLISYIYFRLVNRHTVLILTISSQYSTKIPSMEYLIYSMQYYTSSWNLHIWLTKKYCCIQIYQRETGMESFLLPNNDTYQCIRNMLIVARIVESNETYWTLFRFGNFVVHR